MRLFTTFTLLVLMFIRPVNAAPNVDSCSDLRVSLITICDDTISSGKVSSVDVFSAIAQVCADEMSCMDNYITYAYQVSGAPDVSSIDEPDTTEVLQLDALLNANDSSPGADQHRENPARQSDGQILSIGQFDSAQQLWTPP